MRKSIHFIKEQTCAFTGYRPESFIFNNNEEHRACLLIKESLAGQIDIMAANGVDTFITGMARGVDMWAAEAVLRLKETRYAHLRLIAAVPYAGQDDRWSMADQFRYDGLLYRCTGIITLSSVYYRGCLLARNRFMVDNAHHLIAVYNGSDKGGTAYTVNYARRCERHIVIIDA